MSLFSTIVKFFQDSGVFIIPSIFVLALGLSIAIERFIYLSRSRAINRKMWNELRPLLHSGKFQQVLTITQRSEARPSRPTRGSRRR